jgi:hypothetical protein
MRTPKLTARLTFAILSDALRLARLQHGADTCERVAWRLR